MLADLVDADGVLPYIAPGVTFEGDDIGTWRWRQQEPGTWAQLLPEQRERLGVRGVRGASLPVTVAAPTELRPAPDAALKGPKKAGSKAEAAFQRGLAALAQWVEKEGQQPVPRGAVVEITVDGEADPVPVKLGVWLSNTKSQRDKLAAEQRAALAALGMDWAGPVPVVETASEPPAPQPAPPAAPKKRPPWDHHEECDKTHYEGGTCACGSVHVVEQRFDSSSGGTRARPMSTRTDSIAAVAGGSPSTAPTAVPAKALATGGGRSGRRAVADCGRAPPVLVNIDSRAPQAPPGAVNKCCSKS